MKKERMWVVIFLLIASFAVMTGCSNVSVNKETKEEVAANQEPKGGFPTQGKYDSITNDGISVFYSEGAIEKAEIHLERLLGIKKFYNETTGFDMGFDVYVLNREDYTKEMGESGVPYGLPLTVPTEETGGNPWIFMPATDDGVVTEAAIAFKDRLPEEAQKLVEEAGYTPEEAIKVYTDLIILHEVTHNVAFSAGIKGLGLWFDEAMANFFVTAYLRDKEPKLAKIWEANGYVTYLDGTSPELDKIAVFDENYGKMPPKNYDWYQKQFTLLGKSVYDEMGIEFFNKVSERFKGKTFDNSADFLKELDIITTVFSEWENR